MLGDPNAIFLLELHVEQHQVDFLFVDDVERGRADVRDPDDFDLAVETEPLRQHFSHELMVIDDQDAVWGAEWASIHTGTPGASFRYLVGILGINPIFHGLWLNNTNTLGSLKS